MLSISLQMEQRNRQKLLGQYFSGKRIAEALFDLLGKPTGKTVIDPMCGQADLLVPFQKQNNINGIELDKKAFSKAIQFVNKDSIINGNAFDENTLYKLAVNGYDIVITNPPFIRRENYKKAIDMIDGSLPIDDICRNLGSFTKKTETLNKEQKDKICAYLNSVSGLTDIASFSIILCMVLTRMEGHLALVVPDTWIGREYSAPVVGILKELFKIECIVNDINSVWFEGIAQVKTSLVIAKRTDASKAQNNITIIDAFKGSLSIDSIFSFLCKDQSIGDFVKTQPMGIPGICEIQRISQNDFAIKSGIDVTSKLKVFCTGTSRFANLESYGISCGQGFRSGANACFVFDRNGNENISKVGSINSETLRDYFIPVIQNQKVLGDTYSINSDENLSALLCINNRYACSSDICTIDSPLRESYIPVPHALEEYLSKAELYEVKGTPVPEMSAVKTNARRKDNDVRFWYHFPDFTHRHRGQIFIPRVNGSAIIARLNPNKYIVDANFITFWNTKSDDFSEWLLAFLNSTWFSIMCEESGIVMGGGALKLDAVQLKKIPIPILDKKDLKKLNTLGNKLKLCKIEKSDSIISKIDKVIFGKVGASDKVSLQKIKQIRNEYIARRL